MYMENEKFSSVFGDSFITVTGISHYYGSRPFAVGTLIRCIKEPDNEYDCFAIKCCLPYIGTVGYIANSENTVAGGTLSAETIYYSVPDSFFARIMFTLSGQVICRAELYNTEQLEREYLYQAIEEDNKILCIK